MRIGDETVSLRELDQLVETGQVRALGWLMRSAAMRMAAGKNMAALIDFPDVAVKLCPYCREPLDRTISNRYFHCVRCTMSKRVYCYWPAREDVPRHPIAGKPAPPAEEGRWRPLPREHIQRVERANPVGFYSSAQGKRRVAPRRGLGR